MSTLPQLDPNHPTRIEHIDGEPGSYAITDRSGPPSRVVHFHRGYDPAEGTNGFLIEDLLSICLHRIQHHQCDERWRCRENALAATAIEEAMLRLYQRRARRVAAGTSGTQTPDNPFACSP